MPIHVLFIATAVGTAAVGVGKTVKEGIDNKNAKEININAQDRIDEAKDRLDSVRKQSGKAFCIFSLSIKMRFDNTVLLMPSLNKLMIVIIALLAELNTMHFPTAEGKLRFFLDSEQVIDFFFLP